MSSEFFPSSTVKHISRQVLQFLRSQKKYEEEQQQQLNNGPNTDGGDTPSHEGIRLVLPSSSSSDENDTDTMTDLRSVSAVVDGPQGTAYEGGEFRVKLCFPADYPQRPPTGTFLTRIFHPNVAPQTGEICVDTLKSGWESTTTLQRVLTVIRCLLIEPNPDSALNAEAAHLIQEDYAAFESRARMHTKIYAATKKHEDSVSQGIASTNKENIATKNNSSNNKKKMMTTNKPLSHKTGSGRTGIKASARSTSTKKSSLRRL